VRQDLFDYNDIAFEKQTLYLELCGLSDEVLLDECNFILSGDYQSSMMDKILVSFFKTGKINKEERRAAEGLYLLAHGELAWEI
jgi:hypothetical protein